MQKRQGEKIGLPIVVRSGIGQNYRCRPAASALPYHPALLSDSQIVFFPFMHRSFFVRLIVSLSLCVPLAAQADAIGDALKTGGVALLMRHATAPGVGDPEKFSVNDCSTQRNLSAEGREEAKRIGAHLRALGLTPGAVLTSQWCRCRETAALAFGGGQVKPADWPALNSFFRNRETEAQQAREVLARIAKLKPGEKPLVLVTHQVVISAVTGVFAESGEVVVVAPATSADKPGIRVIGTIKPAAAK